MILETQRLILRPWKESDATSLFKYASDPELGPRAGWPPHQSLDESLTIIKTVFSGDTMWAVELKEASEAIGCIGYLTKGNSNIPLEDSEAEVGYWIAKPFWNRGICSEALRALAEYCFTEKGFTALWGSYFIDNQASMRVMEKCGFRDCNIKTTCPNLEVGNDKMVGVMKKMKDV